MSFKVISTHTLSTTWRTSTTAYFLYQNGDSTYYKAELSGYVSSISSQISTMQTDISGKVSGTLSTWINVTYSSNWVDKSTTYPPTSYMKDPFGFVHLRVNCSSGTTGPIANLPAGYYQNYSLYFPCNALANSTLTTCIVVTATGGINPYNISNSTTILLGEVVYSPST